jgi:AraC family transcriptional regulator
LLRYSSASLLQVALRCGFSSAAHFSNRFRQQTGISPSQYRSQWQQGH